MYGHSVRGMKVRFTSKHFENRFGYIRDYLWNTNDFIVEMDNGAYLPFKSIELIEEGMK